MVWQRRRRGGALGERRLTCDPPPPAVTEALVRPALQLAVAVARAGLEADPAVEAPRALRPFLRFARLPDHALGAVRRALENDPEFRSRVAGAAEEKALGRAAWLFLSRPAGWQEELGELAAAAGAAAEAAREARDERAASRRLAQAQQVLERTEQAAARARAEAAGAAAELAAERRARRAAEGDLAAAAARIASLEHEVAATRQRVEAVEGELARAQGRVAALEGALEAATRPAPPPSLDARGLYAALAVLEDALGAVRQALAEAVGASETAESGSVATAGPEAVPTPAPPSASGPRAGSPAPARRRPTPLPPAVFEDSAEAASHLVRVRGVLLLVDGYNAAMSMWPGLSIEEMRMRLIDALGELAARSGADVHVVFDGAERTGSMSRPGGRHSVRVTFSPPDVEADDVILDLVGGLPAARPVVVASDDRRVREGARARGANVISCAQLSAAVGR